MRSLRRSFSTTSRRRSTIGAARSSRTCAACRARRHWDRFSTRAHSTYSTFTLGQGLPRHSRPLRRAAGHLRDVAATDEVEYGKALGRLLHVNDDERYDRWRTWLTGERPPTVAPLDSREGRLQLMLYAGLGLRSRPIAEMQAALDLLWTSTHIRFELIDLLDVLRSRGFPATEPFDPYGQVPLHSHASYSRYEVFAVRTVPYRTVASARRARASCGTSRIERISSS